MIALERDRTIGIYVDESGQQICARNADVSEEGKSVIRGVEPDLVADIADLDSRHRLVVLQTP